MEERMRFVLRRLDREPMSELCREFGISRKTGYKIFERYQQHGLEALSEVEPDEHKVATSARTPQRARRAL